MLTFQHRTPTSSANTRISWHVSSLVSSTTRQQATSPVQCLDELIHYCSGRATVGWTICMISHHPPRRTESSQCVVNISQSYELHFCTRKRLQSCFVAPAVVVWGSCYPGPRYIGDGVLFSIDFFVSLWARLRENGWIDVHEIFREGVEWPWDDVIFTFWSIPRNRAMPRCAIRGRGLLCFRTTACYYQISGVGLLKHFCSQPIVIRLNFGYRLVTIFPTFVPCRIF